jgi:two-component system NtrC family response regulator
MARVLIVDDTPSTLGALSELLTNAGYEVMKAGSFEEGRRLAEEGNPDLLVIDVRLGPYNGLHLVVRERLAHPDRPVILTTGFPDAVLEAEARRYGAEFMEKPIRSAELIATVKRLLPEKAVATDQ